MGLEGDLAMKISTLQPTKCTSTPTTSAFSSSPIPCTSRYEAPHKFSGSKHESVNSFLEKIEAKFVQVRGVSKSALFLSACDLFTGEAWTWFYNNKNYFADWDNSV